MSVTRHRAHFVTQQANLPIKLRPQEFEALRHQALARASSAGGGIQPKRPTRRRQSPMARRTKDRPLLSLTQVKWRRRVRAGHHARRVLAAGCNFILDAAAERLRSAYGDIRR